MHFPLDPFYENPVKVFIQGDVGSEKVTKKYQNYVFIQHIDWDNENANIMD